MEVAKIPEFPEDMSLVQLDWDVKLNYLAVDNNGHNYFNFNILQEIRYIGEKGNIIFYESPNFCHKTLNVLGPLFGKHRSNKLNRVFNLLHFVSVYV